MNNTNGELPKLEEIMKVILKFKNRRSAGEDGVEAELIKYGGQKNVQPRLEKISLDNSSGSKDRTNKESSM